MIHPQVSSASPRAMATGAAAAASVTQDAIQLYRTQNLEEYQEACRKCFTEHRFDAATAGLTIGNEIMKNIINSRITATQPGQKPTAHNADPFTMVGVFAKTNAAILTAVGRAQYHEDRALTSDVKEIKAVK